MRVSKLERADDALQSINQENWWWLKEVIILQNEGVFGGDLRNVAVSLCVNKLE